MTATLLRSAAVAATCALLVFAVVAYRTAQRGSLEMVESDRAFDAGQLNLSVQHARRAATAFVPGAPHVGLGYERLRAVARGAERARDPELARAAWRAVRAAAIESRHLWQPHAWELAEADAQLARLSATPLAALAAPGSSLATGPLLRVLGLVIGGALVLLGLARLSGGVSEAAGEPGGARAAALVCVVGVIFWGLALLGARG